MYLVQYSESEEAEEIGSEETREIQDDEKTIIDIDIDMDIVVEKEKNERMRKITCIFFF